MNYLFSFAGTNAIGRVCPWNFRPAKSAFVRSGPIQTRPFRLFVLVVPIRRKSLEDRLVSAAAVGRGVGWHQLNRLRQRTAVTQEETFTGRRNPVSGLFTGHRPRTGAPTQEQTSTYAKRWAGTSMGRPPRRSQPAATKNKLILAGRFGFVHPSHSSPSRKPTSTWLTK